MQKIRYFVREVIDQIFLVGMLIIFYLTLAVAVIDRMLHRKNSD